MWGNQPFSQRNKTTERAVGLEVGGDREGVEQNLKKGKDIGLLFQLCPWD